MCFVHNGGERPRTNRTQVNESGEPAADRIQVIVAAAIPAMPAISDIVAIPAISVISDITDIPVTGMVCHPDWDGAASAGFCSRRT